MRLRLYAAGGARGWLVREGVALPAAGVTPISADNPCATTRKSAAGASAPGLPLTGFAGSGRLARTSSACALPLVLSSAIVSPWRVALTLEPPVFYAQTSGTTGKPKHIPVTRSMLAMHRDEQALFSYLQYRACPAAFEGKAFGIMGAASEGRLDSGHVVGSVSGHLYQSLPAAVRSRFVVPPDVLGIHLAEIRRPNVRRAGHDLHSLDCAHRYRWPKSYRDYNIVVNLDSGGLR